MNLKIFLLICLFLEIVSSAPTQKKRTGGGKRSFDLFEGDMKLTPEQLKEIDESVNKAGTVSERKVILHEDYRWPDAEVPYILDSSLATSKKDTVLQAMQHIQDKTCVRFIEYSPAMGDINKVRIFVENPNSCWSNVGRLYDRSDKEQKLNVANWCAFGNLVHELLHTLGLYHEQSRTDRDDYVTIHLENVEGGKENNFNKYDVNHITSLGVPYDYESIMHYWGKAFSKNGQITIETEDVNMQDVIGQRVGLSALDTELINAMYSCIAPTGTTGGNANGASCVFPFIYHANDYSECTTVNNEGILWCATTDNYDNDKLWGNCVILTTGGNANGAACVFPFIYDGSSHSECTTVDNGGVAWCATTGNYDNDELWGNCKL